MTTAKIYGSPVRALLLLLAVVPLAQPQSGAPAKFEVASIKRCNVDPGTFGGEVSKGRITINCLSVKNLIARAYVRFANGKTNPANSPIQIEGAPAWADSDLYTIVAKAEGAPGFAAMQGPMMQALLEDRFRLTLHRRATEIPVYALSVAKGGPRLTPAKEACVVVDFDHPMPKQLPGQSPPPQCDVANHGEHTMDLRGATLEQLGRALTPRLRQPLVDRTGITGHFDFHLDFSRFDQLPATPDVSPQEAGLEAVRAELGKLGLKVEPAKGTGEAIVIDHLERPSEN